VAPTVMVSVRHRTRIVDGRVVVRVLARRKLVVIRVSERVE
jgi:hypothetical protein